MRPWGAMLMLTAVALAGCAADTGPVDDSEPAVVVGGVASAVANGTHSVFPGDFRFPDSRSVPLVDGPFGLLEATTHVLPSAVDGKDIAMTIWRPDTGKAAAGAPETLEDGKVPVIIQASPYYSASANRDGLGVWLSDVIVPHGYAFVALALRSTGDSGGCDDFRGPNMVSDISQAIDWVVEQDWSTDSVGLMGISYHGGTPWYAAGSGNPHVKTIVPVSGTMNAWEVYLRNGTPELRAPIIIPNYGSSAVSNTQRDPMHKVDNFACTEVWEAWAYGVSDAVAADRVHDAWWDERNAKPAVLKNYQGSVFMVHGFEDWNVDPAVAIPFTQDYADLGRGDVKQLIGQWGHTYPDTASESQKRYDWAELVLRWFDRELKGVDVDVGPPVQVMDNQGRWRDELAWPPKDAEKVVHFVAPGLPSEAAGASDTPLSAGQAVTYTMPVDEDLRIAGLPKVHVTVTPTGPSGYMGAFLLDIAPDGTETRIGWTGMNFRFADGGEDPKDVVPGMPLELKMEIQPMDALVPAGHELGLRLGWVLPEDRIPPPHPMPYTFEVGTGVLELPVIERGEEAFFEPPIPSE